MAKKKKSPKRVACTYQITRVDDFYWAKAFDQSNIRYPEADFKDKNREKVVLEKRRRVNIAYSAK